MKISSSTQDKNKVVTVNLSIGQCRLLQLLVDAELCEAEAHYLTIQPKLVTDAYRRVSRENQTYP
jgi:hypothetical protein